MTEDIIEIFSSSKIIALDIETFDPDLKKLGPGYKRAIKSNFSDKNGYILGVAFCNENGFSHYYNLGHPDCKEDERRKNIDSVRSILNLEIPKLGAFILYDIAWLEIFLDSVSVGGRWYDVQIAEGLIDENQHSFSLDFLGKKYVHKGKLKTNVDDYCYKHNLKGDPRKWLFRMPYDVVKDYALMDVNLTLEVLKKQWPILKEHKLLDIFRMECDLNKTSLLLTKTGFPFDIFEWKSQKNYLEELLESEKKRISKSFPDLNLRSSIQLAKAFELFDIDYPLTEKKNPSIDQKYIKYLANNLSENHPGKFLIDSILKSRKLSTLHSRLFSDKFYRHYNERTKSIHPQFSFALRHGSGTRTGRISSSNPNIQQIPAGKKEDEIVSRNCRKIFVPKKDYVLASLDYSQMEYRIIAHYAVGKGAENLRETYNNNPKTDYHEYVMTQTGLNRERAKELNFATAFGMGVNGVSKLFQWDEEFSSEILETFHTKAPYIKSTRNKVEVDSLRNGYIRTILGRKVHLKNRDDGYKMFNYLIQGSAADYLKIAMFNIHKKGILDTLFFHATIHDELVFSVPKNYDGIQSLASAIKEMQNAIPLKVPIIVDCSFGQNWGEMEELNFESFFDDCASDNDVKLKLESLNQGEK